MPFIDAVPGGLNLTNSISISFFRLDRFIHERIANTSIIMPPTNINSAPSISSLGTAPIITNAAPSPVQALAALIFLMI